MLRGCQYLTRVRSSLSWDYVWRRLQAANGSHSARRSHCRVVVTGGEHTDVFRQDALHEGSDLGKRIGQRRVVLGGGGRRSSGEQVPLSGTTSSWMVSILLLAAGIASASARTLSKANQRLPVVECDDDDDSYRVRGNGCDDQPNGESIHNPPLVASVGTNSIGSSRRQESGSDSEPEEGQNQQSSGDDDSTMFLGQCLERQLHRPRVPYPAWDYNWDGRMTQETSFESLRTIQGLVASRKNGVVRHLLLIRHGQYEEDPENDADRVLTPLGRIQAHRTGLRLMQLARGGIPSVLFPAGGDEQGAVARANQKKYDGPCHIHAMHVSDMQRAKETASIISSYLLPVFPDLRVESPDPLLNEALPCPMIPVRPDVPDAETEIDANHDRIEAAFRKYVHRAVAGADSKGKVNDNVGARDGDDLAHHPEDTSRRSPLNPCADGGKVAEGGGTHADNRDRIVAVNGGSSSGGDEEPVRGEAGLRHEFELIVGHGNVIRYFVCRGLQLPPEAWLRFSVFNCSITYMVVSPAGYVSVRSLGDTGHLSYDETTFSGSYGYNW